MNYFVRGMTGALILYGVTALSLLAAPSAAGSHWPAWRTVILILCLLGLAITLARQATARRSPPKTVHQYYSCATFFLSSLTLAMLCAGISEAFMHAPAFAGAWMQAYWPWVLTGASALTVHQFVRGLTKIRARWRSSEDVLQSIISARISVARFAATYDFAFFMMVSIAIGIAGRVLGLAFLPAMSTVLFVLIFPYLWGMQAERLLLLKKLVPDDSALPPQ